MFDNTMNLLVQSNIHLEESAWLDDELDRGVGCAQMLPVHPQTSSRVCTWAGALSGGHPVPLQRPESVLCERGRRFCQQAHACISASMCLPACEKPIS